MPVIFLIIILIALHLYFSAKDTCATIEYCDKCNLHTVTTPMGLCSSCYLDR